MTKYRDTHSNVDVSILFPIDGVLQEVKFDLTVAIPAIGSEIFDVSHSYFKKTPPEGLKESNDIEAMVEFGKTLECLKVVRHMWLTPEKMYLICEIIPMSEDFLRYFIKDENTTTK